LGSFLGLMILLFIFRIVPTWYPQVDLIAFPLIWLLGPLNLLVPKLVPPLGGVDITPVVWVGIFSLLEEFWVSKTADHDFSPELTP